MNVHGLVRLSACLSIDEAGPNALNLNPGSGLLLNMFDKHALEYKYVGWASGSRKRACNVRQALRPWHER